MAHLPPPLKDLKIYINDALGIGSYGKVVRARLGKRPCAAKLLHDTMFIFNDPGLQNFVRKFKEECDLLSSIDHPNVVKYLGTTRDSRSGRPVLLMELMHESLTKYLERPHTADPGDGSSPLSYYSQFSIGHDVALALAYLHSKSIVHRDLSSNNILLTADGTAKVTDFGMSRLIDMHPKATPLTQCPGTLAYMPPEALMTPPQYSDKLDCFSFGVLTIQISTGLFPDPENGTKCVEDPKYPTGRIFVPIPEIERRKKHIDLVEPEHPLLPLAIKCLEDRDTERPSAREICERLAPLKKEEQAKREQKERESLLKKNLEEIERQQKRETEERERRRRKELEEEAKREEKQRRKEEKERERAAKREAKAASKAEAAKRKAEKEQDDSGTASLSLRTWGFNTKKKPTRFVEDGFDLDLSYIRPNIIAMAFPCEKLEGVFRNNLTDVVKFLDTKYPDHYKVYNICSERSYDPRRFHQRVAIYPFDEDEPPPFELIKPFCDDVEIWMKRDDRNVTVVHCNDGLGRTGVMVCSYLLHEKLSVNAQDALKMYAQQRTLNAKAVTSPSQRRFVQYYDYLLRSQLDYSPKTAILKAIIFEGVPHYGRGVNLLLPVSSTSGDGHCLPRFTVHLYKTRVYNSEVYTMLRSTDEYASLHLPQPVPICGDIKITFYHRRRKMFHFWLNTYFIDMHVQQQETDYLEKIKNESSTGSATGSTSLEVSGFPCDNHRLIKHYVGCKGITFPKAELDGAADDSKHFPPYFKVHVIVDTVSDSAGAATSCNMDSTLSDSEEEDDEEDLSDTDTEDEWEWQTQPV